MTNEVLVKLAAPDPWSFTVLDALVRKFGVTALAGVERLKSWRIDFGVGSEGEAFALTSGILDTTALLANPNRDIWTIRSTSLPGIPDRFLGGPRGEEHLFAVRVADKEDLVGASIRAILRRRLHLSKVERVRHSLVWILRFQPGERDPAGLAGEIAVARSWRRGLLANPHCQEAWVWPIEDFVAGGVDRR